MAGPTPVNGNDGADVFPPPAAPETPTGRPRPDA